MELRYCPTSGGFLSVGEHLAGLAELRAHLLSAPVRRLCAEFARLEPGRRVAVSDSLEHDGVDVEERSAVELGDLNGQLALACHKQHITLNTC